MRQTGQSRLTEKCKTNCIKRCFVKSTTVKAWTLFLHRKTELFHFTSHCSRFKSRAKQVRFYLLYNFHFQFTNKSLGSLQLHAVRKNLLLIVTLLHYCDLVLHSVYDPAWEMRALCIICQSIPVPMRISLLIKTIQSDLS